LFTGLKGTALAPTAATTRIPIWQGYSNLVSENAIIGYGMRANRHFGSGGAAPRPDISHPHPHNFAMEMWTDFGAIGVLLLALTLSAFGYASRNMASKYLPTIGAITIAGYSISMTGAAFFQGWWIATLSLSAIAFIAVSQTSDQQS
jgi:O-antigen ligase